MKTDQPDYAPKQRLLQTTIFTTILVTFAMLLAGCGDNSTGPNGGGNGNGNGNGGGIGTEPTFSNVQEIFNQSCGGSSCHIGERKNGVRLDSYNNVMESEGTNYGELVVQAGDAAGSPLVDKIESNPDIGERMPLGGPFLSQERIDQIREWIDNGAEDN